MSFDGPGQRVTVHVGECRCPGTPHASGDEVYLAPEPSLTMGLRANGALAKADGDPALLEVYLGRVFIEEGITGWTFVDEDGDEYGVTPANVELLLPWFKGGQLVAEKANDLYGEGILAPLVKAAMEQLKKEEQEAKLNREQRRRTKKSSANGRSAPSTSATTGSGPTLPAPSRRSSQTDLAAGRPSGVPAP